MKKRFCLGLVMLAAAQLACGFEAFSSNPYPTSTPYPTATEYPVGGESAQTDLPAVREGLSFLSELALRFEDLGWSVDRSLFPDILGLQNPASIIQFRVSYQYDSIRAWGSLYIFVPARLETGSAMDYVSRRVAEENMALRDSSSLLLVRTDGEWLYCEAFYPFGERLSIGDFEQFLLLAEDEMETLLIRLADIVQ